MRKSKEEIELENEDKLRASKQIKKNILTFLCFILLGLGVVIWFSLIKLIENSTNNIYLLLGSIFIFIIYFIFNILILGNMNINQKKNKIEELRKDVKIFSLVARISSIIMIIFDIIIIIWFYLETRKLIYTLIPIFSFGGFAYLYTILSFTFDTNIKEHKRIELNDAIISLLLIGVGILIYLFMPKDIFNINNYISINTLFH